MRDELEWPIIAATADLCIAARLVLEMRDFGLERDYTPKKEENVIGNHDGNFDVRAIERKGERKKERKRA